MFKGLQQPSSMDYHSSLAGVQDDENHDDPEDQSKELRQFNIYKMHSNFNLEF